MDNYNCPRIIIAGLSGDSGKTLVSLGFAAALVKRGYRTAGFKKGPDYIDTAWMKLATGKAAYNLDSYLMDEDVIRNSFVKRSLKNDFSVIEGNRGLFDGFDEKGSHSSAELAKLLDTPLILVLNIKKMTRTAAAIVLGCKEYGKGLNIAGIVLNYVAGKRHLDLVKLSIENDTGIPVIGALPNLGDDKIFPSRHLGLITPSEYGSASRAVEIAREAIEAHIDVHALIEIANKAPALSSEFLSGEELAVEKKIKIGYFYDKSFSFYYPENLEALEERGAELIAVSSLEDKSLPKIDGLYIGGGFPETNIEGLIKNRELMAEVKAAAENNLPIYAECGGLMYLCDSIITESGEYKLCGVFPAKLKMEKKPQGHGYAEAVIDNNNPYFETGAILKGHEFHYSHIIEGQGSLKYSMKLKRGKGIFDKYDGAVYNNVFAAYTHIHALSGQGWAEGFIDRALKYKLSK